MFDIGWSEMMIIALVALIVIGPKELPKTLKTVAQWMRKARSLSREFQSGIDEMVREAELDDARKALEATRSGNLERTLSNALDPNDELASEVRGIEREARREPGAGEGGTAKAKESNAERAASRIVTQPLSVAPPHSLKLPAEKPVAEKPVTQTPAPDKPAGDKPAVEAVAGDDAAEVRSAPSSKQSA